MPIPRTIATSRVRRMLAIACAVQFLVAAPVWAIDPVTPTDADVTFAVQDALLFDASVPSNLIDITTNQGTVTLTGSVDNLRAKDRAVRIAQTVKGVRAVIDRVEVTPSNRSDDEIRQDVTDALFLDPATDAYQITAAVANGEVTLTGTVDSWQEQQLAVQVAEGVRGVQNVVGNLHINYTTTRPDSELLPEVKRVLEHDVLVDASLIDVAVSDGRVALTGTVGSAAERRRARADAWVSGVKSVDATGVAVESWADDPRRRAAPAIKSDDDIQRAVTDAFLHDPRVLSFKPEVSVKGGVVRLSGTVDNLKAKQAAGRDARNTVGVWRVKNYLKVRPADPVADAKIVQSLTRALAFNPLVHSRDITATSHDGRVMLTGSVASYLEKSEAEDVAMRTNGVVAVNNALTVSDPRRTSYLWDYEPFYRPGPNAGPWPYRSDADIREEIQDELFWSPFVDSDDVTVSVDRGVATLTGTVDSWFEYRSAGENAIEGGAVSVINDLIVG